MSYELKSVHSGLGSVWILILGAQNSVLVTWTSVPIIQSSVTGIQTSVIIHRIPSAYLDFAPHDIEPSSVYTEFRVVRGGGPLQNSVLGIHGSHVYPSP